MHQHVELLQCLFLCVHAEELLDILTETECVLGGLLLLHVMQLEFLVFEMLLFLLIKKHDVVLQE